MSDQRIEFAHALRGIAAAFVVIYHIFVVFWFYNADLRVYTQLPLYQGEISFISKALYQAQFFNYGAYGVALFFLISGFVMPYALRRQTRLQFLTARLFRIWPTYLAGLCVSLLAIYIANTMQLTHFFPDRRTVLASILIAPNLFSVNSIDGVIWTLEIEVRFYLLIALFPMLMKGGRCLLLFAGLFMLFSTIFIHKPNHVLIQRFMYVAEFNSIFFSFMFIGCLFNYLLNKTINIKQFSVGLAGLLSAFLYLRYINLYQYPFSTQDLLAYLIALATFAVFYRCRNYIRFPSVFIRLADISYPLYACHAILGYVYLTVFMRYLPYPSLALASYLVLLLTVSYALHVMIELPSNAFGKNIAKSIRELPSLVFSAVVVK